MDLDHGENFDAAFELSEGTGSFDLTENEGRSDWENIDAVILKAIREVEYENPFIPFTITQVQKQLNSNTSLKNKPTRRTIYNHLYGLDPPQVKTHKRGLIDKCLVVKLARGKYSSKMAKIAKSMAQEFLIREFYKTIPRLEGKKFEEFLNRHLSITNKKIKDYKKKSKLPLIGWFYRKKLADLYTQQRGAKANIRNWLYDDFKFIEKSTEISILSSDKIPYFNVYELRESLAKILHKFLKATERHVLEKGESFSLGKCSLNIIVGFSPKKENYKVIGKRRLEQHKESKDRAEQAKQFFPIWLKKKKGIDIDQDVLAYFFLDALSSSYELQKYRENIENLRMKVVAYKRRNKIGSNEMANFWRDFYRLKFSGLLPLAIKRKAFD